MLTCEQVARSGCTHGMLFEGQKGGTGGKLTLPAKVVNADNRKTLPRNLIQQVPRNQLYTV